ncbi:efflux transporter outer membrane subunit [Cupriavidus campinensis]|uniref:Efflux transporter outer membrane subunit n=1 Tax=Cupriavidus campinensis TaxID=151783 RepID=A0ABY3ETI2_9BURK|nr:efflux transporter outer membrane subunit [Cupriavidus campinensis]TSP14267.1 efflux transporter outer membrane subunit [Cupriavidus campinensis]
MCFFINTRRLIVALCCITVGGCAVGPDFAPPVVSPPIHVQRGAPDQPAVSADEFSPDWWTFFGDPVLSRLEREAAAQNLSLKAAAARVEQSRAQVGIAGSVALPQAAAGVSGLREMASANGILRLTGEPEPKPEAASGTDPFGTASLEQGSGPAPYNLWQYGLTASWEIDLWGRARRTKEAALASLQANQYAVEGMKVSLAAEVARTYLDLREAQQQLAVAIENRTLAQHTLRLAKSRESNGVGTRFDAASAGAQLAAVASSLPPLRTKARTLMNALALLLAREPGSLERELGAPLAIPAPPAVLPVGRPGDLAHRRPDILEAEARLHAAIAKIGVAKASFYPSISLTGSFGMQALDFSNIADWGSRQFVLGPVLNLPIFQGGRLKGQLALTEAQQQEGAIAFQATVLKAWHEVDDALDWIGSSHAQQQSLQTAVSESQTAYRTAQRRYEQGASDYLTVLVSQRDVLKNQQDLIAARRSAAVAVVGLYKALGGGWDLQAEAGVTSVERPPAGVTAHD